MLALNAYHIRIRQFFLQKSFEVVDNASSCPCTCCINEILLNAMLQQICKINLIKNSAAHRTQQALGVSGQQSVGLTLVPLSKTHNH